MREVGAEDGGAAQVDMTDFVLGAFRVHMEEDAQAHGEAAGDAHLVAAHQRNVGPAKAVAGGDGGKFGVEVRSSGEVAAGDIVRADVVGADHLLKQLARSVKNRFS